MTTRTRLNLYFDPVLMPQIETLALRRKVSKSAIVEAAVKSYLSGDSADQLEAAMSRRLAHQFWLPEAVPDAATFYVARVPFDSFMELRSYTARRLWRAVTYRPPGPLFGELPAQLRQWHILSLRALDAKLCGESYRTIAEVLLGFCGNKEDFESDPRKSKARRLVAHGLEMMRGGYRLLLHYPVRPRKR